MASFLTINPFPPQSLLHYNRSSSLHQTQRPRLSTTSSSPSSSLSLLGPLKLAVSVEEPIPAEEAPADEKPSTTPINDNTDSSLGGCKACGRAEIERGCNGEGRIQGGIATVPGFGWWPIKAYRPCPGFLESGGRYRRQGQSMDEVAFGRGGRGERLQSLEEPEEREGKGPRKSKG